MKPIFRKLSLIALTTLLTANLAHAADLAAVSPASCGLLKNTTRPFILVMKRGDNLVKSIVDCADAANLSSASLSGLGAIQKPTLGYFNWDTKDYRFKIFPGVFELTSLNGNIGFVDGKRFAHIHVTLGNDQYNVIGGHLKDATVGVTAEITIIPLQTYFERTHKKNNNFMLINTPK